VRGQGERGGGLRGWRAVTFVAGCVQEGGWTALMAACGEGYTNIVELLLAAPGVDVNAAKVSCVSGKQTLACCDQSSLRSQRG
jgi:ankyrin repeat protein